MIDQDKVDILLVDDQPAKLLSYEAILEQMGENLIKAESATEALEQLLKRNVAIILIDVCMPDLDGFQLATIIREHPRFQKTAIIAGQGQSIRRALSQDEAARAPECRSRNPCR